MSSSSQPSATYVRVRRAENRARADRATRVRLIPVGGEKSRTAEPRVVRNRERAVSHARRPRASDFGIEIGSRNRSHATSSLSGGSGDPPAAGLFPRSLAVPTLLSLFPSRRSLSLSLTLRLARARRRPPLLPHTTYRTSGHRIGRAFRARAINDRDDGRRSDRRDRRTLSFLDRFGILSGTLNQIRRVGATASPRARVSWTEELMHDTRCHWPDRTRFVNIRESPPRAPDPQFQVAARFRVD